VNKVAEARLSNTYTASPYLRENATLLRYKDKLVNVVFEEIISVYTKNHTKPINTTCRVIDF
jgi:hypothetical protein